MAWGLFRGSRRWRLDAMPRDGLLLQVSIDSPTPDVHAHRGAGSRQGAVDGIATATALGFRVRLGATLSTGSSVERDTQSPAAASSSPEPPWCPRSA